MVLEVFYKFNENQCSEVRTFFVGITEITFTRVP
jgi:hypothetical protein